MDSRLSRNSGAVTGATKGVARDTAEAFAAEGCDLVLGERDGLALEKLAISVEGKNSVDVQMCAVDISYPTIKAESCIDQLKSSAGRTCSGARSHIRASIPPESACRRF